MSPAEKKYYDGSKSNQATLPNFEIEKTMTSENDNGNRSDCHDCALPR